MLSLRFHSSGDLIADRRFEWARDCESKGDLSGAVDLMRQALEIAPRYASAWFALGGLLEKLGDRNGAISAFRNACKADPDDKLGAALMLMRFGVERVGGMPQAYVLELFDQYAPAFDRALQESLQYRAPALLKDAVAKICVETGRTMRFNSVLDLGCGTGLAGLVFRSYANRLVGVDLSAGMVAKARRKAVYDRLATAEMVQFLADEAASAVRHHLIVAADVFVYAADLTPVATAIARVLAPQGLLAFTVETHNGDGVILGEKLRYAHGEPHVRSALAAGGLDLLHIKPASIRTENGLPAPGLLVVAASTLPRSQS